MCVFLFSGCRGEWDNVSCWQSAAVGEVTTLPCPSPLLHLFGKNGEFFFFFSGVSSGSLVHQQPIRDRERMRRRWRDTGVYQMGENQHDEDEFMRRAAVRKETPAEVMAAGHSSPSQLADLQAQLFSVANHLSSDS